MFTRSKRYSSKAGCPVGYHKRDSYYSKRGTYVPTRCVRSTTVYPETAKEHRAAVTRKMARRLREQIPSIQSLKRKACPPGQIARKAYVRRYSTKIRKQGYTVRKSTGTTYRVYPKSKSLVVGTKCVKDLGLPGKGPREGKGVGPLRKGELKKHGYSFRISESERRRALNSAVKEFGALGVYRKLNAVGKLAMRTLPNAARTFKADRNWVTRKYGPLKAF